MSSARSAASGVSIPRSLTHHVRSRRGRDYRLWLAWPQQPPPSAGYPVIYVLDANATFGTFVEAIRMRAHRPDATGVGPAIVAGIVTGASLLLYAGIAVAAAVVILLLLGQVL